MPQGYTILIGEGCADQGHGTAIQVRTERGATSEGRDDASGACRIRRRGKPGRPDQGPACGGGGRDMRRGSPKPHAPSLRLVFVEASTTTDGLLSVTPWKRTRIWERSPRRFCFLVSCAQRRRSRTPLPDAFGEAHPAESHATVVENKRRINKTTDGGAGGTNRLLRSGLGLAGNME